MTSTVFANGRSIACKGGSGESLAAFPNVCFTPPQAPPTPLGVPLPYPNTGTASKTKSGSKKVVICGKEVMTRDKSFLEKSTGSEAGRAPKKGILTGKNNGGTYFTSWSFDVDIEGMGAPRHLDVTTYNHGSTPGNGATWMFTDRASMAVASGDCTNEKEEVDKHCKRDESGNVKCPSLKKGAHAANAKKVQKDKCQRVARCFLVPWKTDKDNKGKCCSPQTPHHLIPKSTFFNGSVQNGTKRHSAYNLKTAPCVCVEGGKSSATHGLLHAAHARDVAGLANLNFGQAVDIAWNNMNQVLKTSGCSEGCIKKQLRQGGHAGIGDDTTLNVKSQNPKDISSFKSDWSDLESRL